MNDFPILPTTKVAALLDHYPALETVLIALAPPFRKLKNPLLRKGVARVASLSQAAAVAGMPIDDLVNKLRAAVGQPPLPASIDAKDASRAYFVSQPAWFDATRVVVRLDHRNADADRMPIVAVLQKAALLQNDEILELVTSFLPAPGIGVIESKGLLVWCLREKNDRGEELVRTYVSKPRNWC